MRKIQRLLGCSCIVLMCASGPVSAHMLWLGLTSYFPGQAKAKERAYVGWGHRYPIDEFLSGDKLREYALIEPDGTRRKLKPNPGGFLASRLDFRRKGTHILTAAIEPGFFTKYKEDGRIKFKDGPKTGVKGKILQSKYYEMYAKTIAVVGDKLDDFHTRPVGHKLEIIPLQNPAKLKPGEDLQLAVLFNGKPAKSFELNATYMGFSTHGIWAYSFVGDHAHPKVKILRQGVWLVRVMLKLPADGEKADKCDELLYVATLSFEVAK